VDNSFLLITSVGMTFVILSGGIDLSVGAVIALTTVASAYLLEKGGWSPFVVIPLMLLMGTTLGAIMGSIIQYFKVQPFIVTLAGMFFARGMCFFISLDAVTISDPFYRALSMARIPLWGKTFLSLNVVIAAAASAAIAQTNVDERLKSLTLLLRRQVADLERERQIEQDWTGREVRQIGEEISPQAGLNLHLTLDLRLQEITADVLAQFMEANSLAVRTDNVTGERSFPEIEQAAVVALNPKTGEVLAMVNFPTFDNNRFQTEVPVEYYLGLARNEYTPLVNHAISGTYPPGSTFKLVPASAALQEGVVSAERYLFDPGTIEIPNRFAPNDPGRVQEFVCWNPAGHGAMNMRLGIANSCDVYFYKISGGFDQDGEFVEGLTVDRIDVYGTQFGYGRVQGIELPLEAEGNLPTRAWKRQTQGEPWSTGDDYNLGIGQGFMTATPLQQAQMVSVIANGGFLYRPSIIHHMTDAEGNIVLVDDKSQIIARAHQDRNGQVVVTDAAGNPIDNTFGIQFDAEGNYIFQGEVIDTLAVDPQYIQVVADGMEMVNNRMSDTEYFTGATYVDWDALEAQIGATAGKTGTAEYCDNIAIEHGWCRFEDIAQRRILPTHAWYVGYAPVDDPQIAVAVFVFNGGEGSQWAAPVACHVMAAYFGAGQYAVTTGNVSPEEAAELPTVCQSTVFNPEVPQTEEQLAAQDALLEQIQPTPIPVNPDNN